LGDLHRFGVGHPQAASELRLNAQAFHHLSDALAATVYNDHIYPHIA